VALLGHFVEGPSFPKENEAGVIDNSWSEHELEATIDFAPKSRITNWITGGLNTHIAHHLFPKMCHIHYYRITPIIRQYCEDNHFIYQSESLDKALSSHMRYLKKLSQPA
jgi:linoleoyl-CoA desaturase